jgi:hypothetical protein
MKTLSLATFLMFWFQDLVESGVATDTGAGAAGLILIVINLIVFGVSIAMIASFWKIFTKAGEPGWGALVPLYNMILWMKIVNRPIWWLVLLFIPFVGLVVTFTLFNDLAKKFGCGTGFTIGMIVLPFIFLPMLAFGNYQYQRT